jgi:hypothetical protein
LATVHSLFDPLTQHRICLDVTGGTDTRAILICLHQLGFDFDVAINGDYKLSESRIAAIVCNQIRKKLQIFKLNPHKIKPKHLQLAWKACDGLDIALGSYLFEVWRKNNGYSLVVSGAGGNLFKDDAFFRYALLKKLMCRNIRNLIKGYVESGILFWWGIPYEKLNFFLTKKYGNIAREIFNDLEDTLVEKYGPKLNILKKAKLKH